MVMGGGNYVVNSSAKCRGFDRGCVDDRCHLPKRSAYGVPNHLGEFKNSRREGWVNGVGSAPSRRRHETLVHFLDVDGDQRLMATVWTVLTTRVLQQVGLVLLMLILDPMPLSATNINDFFQYDASAKEAAISHSSVASPNDLGGVFTNPSSVAGVTGASYSELFMPLQDSNLYIHSIAAALTQRRWTVFGGCRMAFNSDLDSRRYIDFVIPNDNIREGCLGIAVIPCSNVAVGLSGQFYGSSIMNYPQGFATAGIGIRVRFKRVACGVYGNSLGHKMKRTSQGQSTPSRTRYAFGSSVCDTRGTSFLASQVEFDYAGRFVECDLGTEVSFSKVLTIRLGYNATSLESMEILKNHISAGIGVSIGRVRLDYAAKHDALAYNGYVHWVTLSMCGSNEGR